MVKDFLEYQQLALRTLNERDQLENVLHCVMGMSGEVGEFVEQPAGNDEQKIGEVGDCFWYAAIAALQVGAPFDVIVSNACTLEFEGVDTTHPPTIRAVIHSATMLDMVKKTWFYGKPLNIPDLVSALTRYVSALLDMCGQLEADPLYVADTNIRKLQARFPDKFDAEKAINRDYAAESVAAGIAIE